MLTDTVPPSGANNVVDPTVAPLDHTYGYKKGELSGIIYTCRAGFIDLGHTRDLMDLTRYYHGWIVAGKNKAGDRFRATRYSGLVDIKKDIPAAEQLEVARSIAFDSALFHELYSYWVGHPNWYTSPYFIPGLHNSSFSPEDLPSNFLGTHVAAQVINGMKTGGNYAGKSYDEAATAELELMMASLVALPRAGTVDAIAKAGTAGWIGGSLFFDKYLKRRNFKLGPVEPWKLSGVTGCTGTPPPLAIPLSFKAGTDTYYDLLLEVPEPYQLHWAARSKHKIIIFKSDFAAAMQDIKDEAKSTYGVNYDKP